MLRLLSLSSFLVFAVGCAHAPKPTEEAAPVEVAPVKAEAPAPVTEAPPPSTLKECPLVRVHFALDEALVRQEDLPLLDQVAQCLKKNQSQQVIIEGNADERGTEEYNLSLSSKRAESVAKYLAALGVSRQQMDTVSYGDVRPVCTEHDEKCWAQNRRVALTPQK